MISEQTFNITLTFFFTKNFKYHKKVIFNVLNYFVVQHYLQPKIYKKHLV